MKNKAIKPIELNNIEEHELNFDPAHFIRCHGTGNSQSPADTKTSIWDAAFEPDAKNPGKLTRNVATCGGNSLCITDIESGQVLMKYSHKDKSEDFYTLCWTLLPSEEGHESSILATGSAKGEICLFHPEKKVCFYTWPIVKNLTKLDKKRKRSIVPILAVNSLVFHSKNTTWLFIGLGNGVIYLYDIGNDLVIPNYSKVAPNQLLKLDPYLDEVYNILWTGDDSKWLLAGAKGGLVGWYIDETKILEENAASALKPVYIKLPKSSRPNVDNSYSIVDSICMIDESTIISKCILHGCMYVFNLTKTVTGYDTEEFDNAKRIEKDAKLVATLDWSKTDNYYMNIGCNSQGLICCGDDEGALWLYNQPGLNVNAPDVISDCKKESKLVKANIRLLWPDLQDEHLENSKEQPEKYRYDIVVDKVIISEDSQYLVAVTSNNMICIWKRQYNQEEKVSNLKSDIQ